MLFTRKFFKASVTFLIFLLFLNSFCFYKNLQDENFKMSSLKSEVNKKISWENLDWINYEKTRSGPGEQGLAYIETDPELINKNENWAKQEGFWVEVSNKISLTRALPDYGLKICSTKTYFEDLPNVSVIIVFHNEVLSTLLRCVHSVYNRSPKQLLHEIILINDKSTFPELYENLREIVKKVFGTKIKLIENEERQGLIKARMTGAKAATGKVIIFLDSHMEVFNSWLPPLLDPIVTNPTVATVPIIDGMNHKTFQPQLSGYGFRGVFDWNFRYQYLPLRPQDKVVEGEPYELACLTGGAYAIRREHFFYLGGYDEGLQIWNGENYELCLKLWLCSGGLLSVPCSRVTHLSKIHSAYRLAENGTNFAAKNLKRVVEVWLDEYKEYFHRGNKKSYDEIDAGDLTAQFEKKKSLNCKPFKYFLDVVAPDMIMRYPIVPQQFAAGNVQPESIAKCLGSPDHNFANPIGLVDCTRTDGIDFILTLEKSLKYNDTNDQCLESRDLSFKNCNHQLGNQLWKFDIKSRQIISLKDKKCLTANITSNVINLLECDSNLIDQKWKWTYENQTALKNWEETGVQIV